MKGLSSIFLTILFAAQSNAGWQDHIKSNRTAYIFGGGLLTAASMSALALYVNNDSAKNTDSSSMEPEAPRSIIMDTPEKGTWPRLKSFVSRHPGPVITGTIVPTCFSIYAYAHYKGLLVPKPD